MTNPDILIIGSGPAGINVAWPLVLAGKKVLMIDAETEAPKASPSGNIEMLRRQSNSWKYLFGKDLNSMETDKDISPKFSTPLGKSVIKDNKNFFDIQSSNFINVRTSMSGGLSNIWGGFCSAFDSDDLKDYPISVQDLEQSYAEIAQRIGISGKNDAMGKIHGSGYLLHTPVNLTKPAAHIYSNYSSSTSGRDFILGLARNAVITENHSGREACNQCGLCLYGCSRKSIYNSAYELAALNSYPNFTYKNGLVATRLLNTTQKNHCVQIQNHPPISASKIVLASGTLNTTGMILDYTDCFEKELPLLTNPVAAMAFIVPKFIGSHFENKTFSLGQLSYKLALANSHDYAMGVIYGGDALPLTTYARHMSFSRPTAMQLSAALAPALLLTTAYLPGSYSSNTIRLEKSKNDLKRHKLIIDGSLNENAKKQLKNISLQLSKNLKKTGAYLIPGSLNIAPPGADAHLAGTIPMGGKGELSCSKDGELNISKDIYLVDGTSLSSLPAKHCSFTIMANAFRIGTHLAQS
jgi:choline dehydrogenase-like flavoprotein